MSTPSPGWNPDPTGRHEYRYWDGQDWTDDVSDDGVTSVDALDAAAPPGGEPTAPFDPTQQYTPPGQADPYGTQPGGYGPQPGPGGPGEYGGTGGPGGYGQPPGVGGPGGYGSGPMPPAKSGPNVPLIVGGAVVALLVVVALVVLLTRGGDDDKDDDVATDDVTTTTADDVTTTTEDVDEPDETTTTTEGSSDPTTTDVFSLAVGDCFLELDGNEVPLVPCDEPHDNEVFHLHDIEATERPSDEEMTTIVEQECHPAFESYVGTAYASSELYIRTLKPSEDTWSQGDRELVCILYDPDGQITGSAAGTNR